MDDPLEELKERGRKIQEIAANTIIGGPAPPDLCMHLKPLSDGIFPKKVTVRKQSTDEIVFEAECGPKGSFTWTPEICGNYIIEFYPKMTEDIPVNVIEGANNDYTPEC